VDFRWTTVRISQPNQKSPLQAKLTRFLPFSRFLIRRNGAIPLAIPLVRFLWDLPLVRFLWDLALGPLTSGARRALTTSHPPACCPPPRAASTHSPPCLKLNVLVCSLPPASRLTASVAARRWTAIASTSVPQVRHPSKSPPSCRTFKHFGTPQTFTIQGFLQGYLGYKKTLARGSVGLRFLKIRKRRENPVGPFFLGLRKRRGRIRCAFLGCAFL